MTPPAEVELSLPARGRFDFEGTAMSHGWVVLAPNAWEASTRTLHRVLRLGGGEVVRLEVTGTGTPPDEGVRVRVAHEGTLGTEAEEEVRRAVRRMLRLDEDLSEFHDLCRDRGGRWERVPLGLGRLLRSPTVFEDVLKTICTTNIRWGGTKRMVAELVEEFGDPLPDALRLPTEPASPGSAFPTPGAIASVSGEEFRRRVNLGYRAPWVHELARRVHGGELDLAGLDRSDEPTPELRRRILQLKGVGDYAAATILMLLGRYDELAVDSVFREFVAQRHFDGERPSDERARAVYRDWGEWKFLAYWFDLWEGSTEDL